MRNDRNLHSRQVQIESELLRTVAFRATIESRKSRADESKLRRLLELHACRHRHPSRSFCEFSILCGLSRRSANNAAFRPTLSRHHLPPFGRGSDKHGAHLRPEFPVLLERVRNRTRSADKLKTSNRVFVDVRSRCKFWYNLRPICVEFVGQNYW